MTDERAVASGTEEVVEETINAYRVQKLADGRVRIQSGGNVVFGDTYLEALERYATGVDEHVPGQVDTIHDGYVPLLSMDSAGFTPEEILNAITTTENGWHVKEVYQGVSDD